MLANVLQIFFYIFMLLAIAGDFFCSMIGVRTPEFLKQVQENKWSYCIGGFFVFA